MTDSKPHSGLDEAMERAHDSWHGRPYPVGPGVSEEFARAVQDRTVLAAEVTRLEEQLETLRRHDEAATQDAILFRKELVDAQESLKALHRKAGSVVDSWLLWQNDVDVAHLDHACAELNAHLQSGASASVASPNVGERTDSAGYCGRHGLFVGRMCAKCAEEAASSPAREA